MCLCILVIVPNNPFHVTAISLFLVFVFFSSRFISIENRQKKKNERKKPLNTLFKLFWIKFFFLHFVVLVLLCLLLMCRYGKYASFTWECYCAHQLGLYSLPRITSPHHTWLTKGRKKHTKKTEINSDEFIAITRNWRQVKPIIDNFMRSLTFHGGKKNRTRIRPNTYDVSRHYNWNCIFS